MAYIQQIPQSLYGGRHRNSCAESGVIVGVEVPMEEQGQQINYCWIKVKIMVEVYQKQ